MKAAFLGWDVGPWKCSGNSKDALQLLEFDGEQLYDRGAYRGNLLDEFNGDFQIEDLFRAVKAELPTVPLVIGIDAVFGWPASFVSLIARNAETSIDPKGLNIHNRYLYRITEEFIYSNLKFPNSNPPLSAVGDKIGPAATKAQYFLSRLTNLGECYIPPLDEWNPERAKDADITIIEVYPGASKKSQEFESLPAPSGLTMSAIGSGDQADATRCAMTAYCYAATVGLIDAPAPQVHLPSELPDSKQEIEIEGWIFAPRL